MTAAPNRPSPLPPFEVLVAKLSCEQGAQTFCLPLLSVRELTPFQKPTPILGNSGLVRGLLKSREDLAVAIDLAALIGAYEHQPEDTLFVVCEVDDKVLALPVAEVLGIASVGPADLQDASKVISSLEGGVISHLARLKEFGLCSLISTKAIAAMTL